MNKKLVFLSSLIVVIFISIIILFTKGLSNNSQELQLITKGKKITEFSLPSLTSDKLITNKDLTSKKPYYLVNFWGSWCDSCYEEHPYLLELSKTETIYGVNWKDSKDDGLSFINKGGNPFKEIIVDNNSLLAIGMGVYGAPETFLIKADGTILHRFVGRLDKKIWEKEFVSKIKAIK